MIKDGYKKTGIGYIPLDWEVKKFKDITDILRCGLASTPKYVEDGVPFLSAQNVKNGKLNLDKYKCISNELHEKLTKNTKPQKNDILMTRVGNVGDAAIVDIDWEFSVYVSLTHIRMKEGYDSQFFTQLLNSSFIKRRSLQTQYKGGGVANLNVRVVEEFDMPVPPLKEQQKIAEILSSVDAAIEKTEQVIAKTEEVKKGLMQQLLTKGIGHTEFKQTEIGEIPIEWGVKSLQQLSSFMSNGFVGVASPFYTEDCNGVNYLMSNNVRANKFDLTKLVKITLEFHQKQCKTILKKGDMLTVQSGHIGTSCIVNEDFDGANCHALIITRFEESVNPTYVSYYLNSTIGYNNLKKIFVGSTIKHINVKDFKGFKVPVPSFKEQTEIVSILKNIDEKISKEEEELLLLHEIKQGLMQQLLTGQVRVKID